MARPQFSQRFERIDAQSAFARDVLAGLKAERKTLSPKYFYDHAGSRLFERIGKLPEYYPTRTELALLRESAHAIARDLPAGGALIEFGSGSTEKVRLLLREAPQLAAYVPVDISAEFLRLHAQQLHQDFPNLLVVPVEADFSQPFAAPAAIASLPRAGFFPGSTIGNFEPHEASTFLHRAREALGAGARLIIGVDLVKDRTVLHAAYNDSAGVTAEFNRNVLVRINRELGANFDVAAFEHHACYNRELSRVEMYLASTKRQRVRLCGESIDFRAGETIHTENSYKYTVDSFSALARGSKWEPQRLWTDSKKYFAVFSLTAEH
jgi:dimethylhistidine N-methyltransferase